MSNSLVDIVYTLLVSSTVSLIIIILYANRVENKNVFCIYFVFNK